MKKCEYEKLVHLTDFDGMPIGFHFRGNHFLCGIDKARALRDGFIETIKRYEEEQKIITTKVKISEIIENKTECPIPLDFIPNKMGINLCSVDSIEWKAKQDGQLISTTINFIPTPLEHLEVKSKV